MNSDTTKPDPGRPMESGRPVPVPTGQDVPHNLRIKVGAVAGASLVGLLLAQLITIGQTIVLAHLLTPAQVGLFAAGSVLMAFMANLTEGGMRTALIQRRDSLPEATETVFWATLVSGLAMSLIALAAAPVVSVLFNSHDAGVVGAAIAPTMFLFALASVPEALLQREFNVRRRLIVGPSVSGAFAIFSISGALCGLGVWSLVLGTYAQCAALLLTTWTVCRWRPGRVRPSYRLWRELARYGFPLTVSTFLLRSKEVLFRVVIGRSLGTATLGQYRYGERLAQIPFLAVLEVGSYALLPAFSRVAHDPGRLRRTFLDALRWGSLGGAAAAGVLAALGQTAVVLLLGDQWREAGMVAATMAGLALGTAWSAAGGEALSAAGRTVRTMNTTVFNIVVGLTLLVALIGPFGVRGVGLAISIAQLLAGAMVLLAVRPVVDVSGRTMVRTVLPTVLAAIAAAGVTYSFNQCVAHTESRPVGWGLLILSGETLLFFLVFLSICALLDEAIRSGLYAGVRTAWGWARPLRVDQESK